MRKKILRMWKWIIVLVGFVASAISLYVYFGPKSQNMFEVKTALLEPLTERNGAVEPDLVGLYYFKKIQVSHLWRATVSFVNKGDRNIIGKGPRSDLIEKYLSFQIPKSYRILKVEKLIGNMPHVPYWTYHTIAFDFTQWKKDEQLVYAIHIETPTSDIDKKILAEKTPRQISNYDISFPKYNFAEKFALPSTSWNPAFRQTAYIASILFLVFLSVLLALHVFFTPIYFVKKRFWLRRYLTLYDEFIQNRPDFNPENKSFYQINPRRLPKFIWRHFGHPRYPYHLFDFESESVADFAFSMTGLGFLTMSVILLLIDIFYYWLH